MMPTYCSCCRISSKRGGARTQPAAFTQSTEKTVAIFDCGNLWTEVLDQRKISRHNKKMQFVTVYTQSSERSSLSGSELVANFE